MSLGSTQPFRPSGTVMVSAGTTSANAFLPPKGEAVLVSNTSSGVAFVRFGTDATVVATTADTPVMPGLRMLMHAGGLATTVAVLLNSGSGGVYVTRGDGTVY